MITERFDILAWNAGYAALFPATPSLPPGERNQILQCFTTPECCRRWADTGGQRAAMVAQLRTAYGRHLGEPAWTAFVKRMEAVSPEFARMWATQDVAHPRSAHKVFRHPEFPRLPMTSTSMALQHHPGARMVVYTPDDERTWQAMRYLTSRDRGDHTRFPCAVQHLAMARELADADYVS